MNKLCINGKFFSQRVTGTQRYARELMHQFDKLLGTNKYRGLSIQVLVPGSLSGSALMPAYTNLEVRPVGRMGGTKWEQTELPYHSRGQVLLTLSGGAPILHPRNVVALHDAAVAAAPAGYSLPYRVWHKNICRRMARSAEHIFANSHFSKSEIVKWYGADPKKISVISLGSDHASRPAADTSALQRFGLSGKYVLAVSSHNPNKNFPRIVRAISYLNHGTQLAIAGGHDSRIYRNGLRLPAEVRVLGYVSDAELRALYENAACFVFPSLYEGFGLPPLEAMSYGCPVVLSRTASLPELFEGTASFCDPYSPPDIARAIQRALESPPLPRDELKAFADKFSWERCARQTLDVIQNL